MAYLQSLRETHAELEANWLTLDVMLACPHIKAILSSHFLIQWGDYGIFVGHAVMLHLSTVNMVH